MDTNSYRRIDFNHSPFLVFYELTQACDLVCAHCRACAQPLRHPEELSTERSMALIDQLTDFPRPPLLVLTGGDPLKRPDIAQLVRHASGRGLEVAMTPSATPLVTLDSLNKLREAGLSRLAVSLDGADAATHDAFRGFCGSFAHTMKIISMAQQVGLPLQINTTMTRRNLDQVDAMAELLAHKQILLWAVFFLVPVGKGLNEQRLSPEQCEQVFERLWHHAQSKPYGIKTTEGHHYRRYVLQHRGNPQRSHADGPDARIQRAPLGVNDGKGVMFVSHTGHFYPSGFMPISCGQFPKDSVVDVYQNSALFVKLRNPDLLEGKCGRCEFRQVCGGSRARAYALTGNAFAEEPDCIYRSSADNKWSSKGRPAIE